MNKGLYQILYTVYFDKCQGQINFDVFEIIFLIIYGWSRTIGLEKLQPKRIMVRGAEGAWDTDMHGNHLLRYFRSYVM